ncbi:MAG: Na+/H+ antiporter NhaA [Haliscomenobacteraceae bacterium CHB4]|nr:Na+/H+ antiporter NhaA [Haliscomenobacteraceae bacterium CHB4]
MITKLTRLFTAFFDSERIGGYLLMGAAILSVAATNSAYGPAFTDFWETKIAGEPVRFWINDGLMAVFFLLVGLEIERELYIGELSERSNAILPVAAALGGMLLPAGLFLAFNAGYPSQYGFGIPMATDIAFALGVLGLIGNRVPVSIKVFLTALAIIDDLGAILVIAFFYSKTFSWMWLGISTALFGIMLLLNRFKVRNLILYLLLGVGLWYVIHHAGIHATIAGVLTAFVIPFGDGGKRSPSYLLQHLLHRPAAFFILPMFALANTGLTLEPGWEQGLTTPVGLGIIAGLFLGKPAGVLLGVWLGRYFAGGSIPQNTSWMHYIGAGLLAGIGFTMSIFIALLAFDSTAEVALSKTAIFAASLLAGIAGYAVFKFAPTR